jgi:transposase
MDNIGLDLHKRESQLCILTEDGEIVERRIQTSRERFTAVLGERPRARLLLEASTESEWVARHLEALGHEVIVADPNFAPMYATRRRGVKTDRRDARTLAEACRLGAYRPAHRASDGQRHVRAELAGARCADPHPDALRRPDQGTGPAGRVAAAERGARAHRHQARGAAVATRDLGLTPREYSSGEQQRRGRISKTGNARMRALAGRGGLARAAHQGPRGGPVARVGGTNRATPRAELAAVALARRLAGILYAMWRDGRDYGAPRPSEVVVA